MNATTIKVPVSTRDRLKAHAAAHGETLAVHVERLLDLADREDRFASLRGAIAQTRPEDLESYESERDAWLDADLS